MSLVSGDVSRGIKPDSKKPQAVKVHNPPDKSPKQTALSQAKKNVSQSTHINVLGNDIDLGAKIGRREFIQAGAMVGGVEIARRLLNKPPIPAEAGAPIVPGSPNPMGLPLPPSKDTPVPTPKALSPSPTPTEVRKIQEELAQVSFEDFIKKNPFFYDYSQKEKDDLVVEASKQLKALGGEGGSKNDVARVLQLKGAVEDCWKKVEPVIKEKFTFDPNPVIPRLLLPIIYIESKGVAGRTSKAGAVGLCQLKPKTAEGIKDYIIQFGGGQETLNRLGIKTPINLNDERTNLTFGLLHLSRLLNSHPEVGLAIWSYHMGDGDMIEILKHYFEQPSSKFSKETVEDLLEKQIQPPGTSILVSENNLNYPKVFNSPGWKELPQVQVDRNETSVYFPRFTAAWWLIQKELQKRKIS